MPAFGTAGRSVPGAAVPGGAVPGSAATAALASAAAPAVLLIPPSPFTPMAFTRRAVPSQAPQEAAGQDAGTGADSGTATFGDSDTGSGTDSGSVTVTASGTDTGTGADAAGVAVTVNAADTGAGADTGISALVTASADAGSGTDRGGFAPPPVTGAGTVQQLNPVRESMAGLDVTLHLAQALGAVLRFANHGSERLYVLATVPGVTLTVTDGGMVLDQEAQPFPPVALTAGHLYAFGPFHSVLQVPGTSTVQAVLSTTSGVQVLVVQGPGAH